MSSRNHPWSYSIHTGTAQLYVHKVCMHFFIQFYPFGLVHNDQKLSTSSLTDGHFASVFLTGDYFFYENIFRTAYVRKLIKCYVLIDYLFLFCQINENGVISFANAYNVHTPLSLPFGGRAIIAPYWADADLRGTGQVFYRQTTEPSLLARATSEIRAAFNDSQTVTIRNLLIVTWDRVPYHTRNVDKVH